jgi:hypothetical protein
LLREKMDQFFERTEQEEEERRKAFDAEHETKVKALKRRSSVG